MGLFSRRKVELPPKVRFERIYDLVMSIERDPDTPVSIEFQPLVNGRRLGYEPDTWLEVKVSGKAFSIAPHDDPNTFYIEGEIKRDKNMTTYMG